ncbi:BA75_03470T0 [Komagataella pastoris]|uniref:20S-pre-rRNA D-site endonuclease NOB1 n=1 Tax=Komagataella pastoris TaxID=4922 RepID=A0A1B2JGT2_PICPA|nr:BA75_03470T0 [Komagataella pastoris]
MDQKINTLILDASPLITQPAAQLMQYAENFFTTPGVFLELKDDNVKKQLFVWGDRLKIRHPKSTFIKKVQDFARLTGDLAVLSTNDLHVIALAYELESELNNGKSLRSFPGERITSQKDAYKENPRDKTDISKEPDSNTAKLNEPASEEKEITHPPSSLPDVDDKNTLKVDSSKEDESQSNDGFIVVKSKKNPKGGQKTKKATTPEKEKITETTTPKTQQTGDEENSSRQPGADKKAESLDEQSDDDGNWITPDNLVSEMLKDSAKVQQTAEGLADIKVALTSGDFACQNVALRIGIHLMNYTTGMRIKRVNSYMYRCHACFKLVPLSKNGLPRHFCPSCGGNTLKKCSVSVNSKTGELIPHLKKNYVWNTRGDKYTLSSPQSKNASKRQGNAGYQHDKLKRGDEVLLLREDQKEYQQAILNEQRLRRQNEKLLEDWVGGGSADNFISPFTNTQHIKQSGVKIGKGRRANASKKKK